MGLLYLDKMACRAALAEIAGRQADIALERFFSEVQGGMNTSGGKNDIEKQKLDDVEKGILKRQIVAGALAIMDSWGTGSMMDKSNPILQEYKGSALWNPARTGNAIVGRPKGTYTDILGEQQESSGALKGVNLEKLPNSPIKARAPSGAFQDAQAWLKGNMQETLQKISKEFAQEIRTHASKYFTFR